MHVIIDYYICMLCFQSLAMLPSLKWFSNTRRRLRSAEPASINSEEEQGSYLLLWEDSLSGCKSNQTNSACLVQEHMWCWPCSLGEFSRSVFGHFWYHWVSLLAPFSNRCSPLASVEFITHCFLHFSHVASYHWFPMYDNSKTTTDLRCNFKCLDLPAMLPFL